MKQSKFAIFGVSVLFLASLSLVAAPANGKAIFKTNCASCHGASGGGDGSAAKALNPKPRNFKKGLKGFKYGTSLAAIKKTISEGVKGTGMPPWKYSLKPAQIDAVAKYVRGIAAHH